MLVFASFLLPRVKAHHVHVHVSVVAIGVTAD
jgi:hypothetical protein